MVAGNVFIKTNRNTAIDSETAKAEVWVPNQTDTEKLLKRIPEDGTAIGNMSLQKQFPDWPSQKFWRARDSLLDAGLLERGKGKGGSVRRPVKKKATAKATPILRGEKQLYEPLLKVLQDEWVPEMRIDPNHIYFEITASQGKKATGGTWTRPDITAVSVRTFQHLPLKYFDVWTFEVKPVEALDITAIFEAASHASRATRSYALLQISGDNATESDIVDRCIREAGRLQVGLIIFSDATDFETWETKVEAPRLETAPEALNEFVGYLSEGAKKISRVEVG